jgi:acetylserotonin N-methyltransferase
MNEKLYLKIVNSLSLGEASLEYNGNNLTNMWTSGVVDPRTASSFTELMQVMMAYPADILAQSDIFKGITKLVDVGGGSGAWAVALGKHQPHIEVTIFDLPEVIKEAEQNVKKLMPLKEVKFQAGSFFTDEIQSSQAYLLSNILHDWPVEKCKEILMNISRNAEPGALVIVNECLMNDEMDGPEFTMFFSLLMAVNHGARQFKRSCLFNLLLDYEITY